MHGGVTLIRTYKDASRVGKWCAVIRKDLALINLIIIITSSSKALFSNQS